MTEYRVEWAVDLDADSPFEAAVAALQMQRDPDSTATTFYVCDDIEGHGKFETITVMEKRA
jgi:hypothetical protein